MEYKIYLQRLSSSSRGTIGRVTVPAELFNGTIPLVFHSLEPSIPCLSVGKHKCVYSWSNKFNKHMCFVEDLQHVGIMFHVGNTVKDTSGCVLLGSNSHDYMLTHSRKALDKFNQVVLPLIASSSNKVTLIVT